MQIPQKPIELDVKLLPRTILSNIKKSLFDRDILVLTGARQTGKTSIMHLIYNYLIKQKNINPKDIFFFDLEDIQVLEAFEKYTFDKFANYIKKQSKKQKFVFIDEIQYLKNPSSFLKIIHDHYPKIKLIVSGSSSLELKRKFKDSLTGRKQIFIVNSLSFQEYLLFKNKPKNQKEFEEFSIFGGYPEIALINDFDKKASKLREIYTSYIKKDIKDLMNIENAAGFNKLVSLIAHQIGNLMNIDELANSSGLARDTVSKYLLILENTFVIDLIYPYFTNKRKELVKMPKIYFKDTGLRNVITKNLNALEERNDKGSIIENSVLNELSKTKQELCEIKFWRTQTKVEVDFILEEKNIMPIEVKYQFFKTIKIPSGIRSFIKTYNPAKAQVITKNFSANTKLLNSNIKFIPAWKI